MDSKDNSVVLHGSLTRPILFMGAERELVILIGVIAAIFFISLGKLWAAIVGIVIWIFGIYALSKMAEIDPQLSKTSKRSLKYRKFYSAQATPFAEFKEHKDI